MWDVALTTGGHAATGEAVYRRWQSRSFGIGTASPEVNPAEKVISGEIKDVSLD